MIKEPKKARRKNKQWKDVRIPSYSQTYILTFILSCFSSSSTQSRRTILEYSLSGERKNILIQSEIKYSEKDKNYAQTEEKRRCKFEFELYNLSSGYGKNKIKSKNKNKTTKNKINKATNFVCCQQFCFCFHFPRGCNQITIPFNITTFFSFLSFSLILFLF